MDRSVVCIDHGTGQPDRAACAATAGAAHAAGAAGAASAARRTNAALAAGRTPGAEPKTDRAGLSGRARRAARAAEAGTTRGTAGANRRSCAITAPGRERGAVQGDATERHDFESTTAGAADDTRAARAATSTHPAKTTDPALATGTTADAENPAIATTATATATTTAGGTTAATAPTPATTTAAGTTGKKVAGDCIGTTSTRVRGERRNAGATVAGRTIATGTTAGGAATATGAIATGEAAQPVSRPEKIERAHIEAAAAATANPGIGETSAAGATDAANRPDVAPGTETTVGAFGPSRGAAEERSAGTTSPADPWRTTDRSAENAPVPTAGAASATVATIAGTATARAGRGPYRRNIDLHACADVHVVTDMERNRAIADHPDVRARRNVEVAQYGEARHPTFQRRGEGAAEEQRAIAIVTGDGERVGIDDDVGGGDARVGRRTAEAAIEQVQARQHLRGVAAAHEVLGVLGARTSLGPRDQHFIATGLQIAEGPFRGVLVVDAIAEGVVALQRGVDRIEIATPARGRKHRHRIDRADDTGIAVVDQALAGEVFDVRDRISVQTQHFEVVEPGERLGIDDRVVAQAEHAQVRLPLQQGCIDNRRGHAIGHQHRGRDDLLRPVDRVVAELDPGAAARIEVVEAQVVPALREHHAAGLLEHAVRAVVVDYQAAVDGELAAVVGFGEENHAARLADPDLAGPAPEEQVVVHAWRKTAGGRRTIDRGLDAGEHGVVVAEERDEEHLVDLVHGRDRVVREETLLRLVPVACRQAGRSIVVERQELQPALAARGLLPLERCKLGKITHRVAVE